MIYLLALWAVLAGLALALLIIEFSPWFQDSQPASKRQTQEALPEETRTYGNCDVLPREGRR